MKIGAIYLGDNRCEFRVWAPLLEEVIVEIVAPEKCLLPMQKDASGYWRVTANNVAPGTRYVYQLEGMKSRPDPASYYQPHGVHEPSQVVNHRAFVWEDTDWTGIALEELIIYELHVGLFTPTGTFEAIIPRLAQLRELGVNAIELMPVAQFAGERNWGYDGVYPFAVQNSYGTPEGLKRLVNACHQQGIAVIQDVAYNHFGPEGNYTRDFAPYFTDKHRTPWGNAINFDDAYSDGVRNVFIENALYWFREYHIDALRLDAIHTIYDFGAKHFLAELAEEVAAFSQQQGRKLYLIADSDLNDVRVIQPQAWGGYGIDAQWNDDFHHALHALLTGEQAGIYQDFGKCEQLAKAFREGFVYSGQYSPYRRRRHGNFAGSHPPSQFAVYSQNHTQVGDRMLGERLSNLISFDALKLAAASVILSPYIPLLFMGEEYGEESPFLYFTAYSDSYLIATVTTLRKSDFAASYELPDAQSEDTFNQCKLNWEQRKEGKHGVLLALYQRLIQLRHQIPALRQLKRQNLEVSSLEGEKILSFRRQSHDSEAFCLMNFGEQVVTITAEGLTAPLYKQLDSSESQWLASGSNLPEKLLPEQTLTLSAQSFVLYANL